MERDSQILRGKDIKYVLQSIQKNSDEYERGLEKIR